jgi:hypothetical protein
MAYPLAAAAWARLRAEVVSQSRNWLTERLMDVPQIRRVLADWPPYSAGSRKNSEDY